MKLLLYPFQHLVYLVKLSLWYLRHGSKKTHTSKPRYRLLFASTLLLALLPLAYYLSTRPQTAEAGWFNPAWQYRKLVPLANAGASGQTDFQLQLTLDTAALVTQGKLQSDCDDLRFTAQNGDLLPYWLEPGTCNTATTLAWIKVPEIFTSGANVYLYYGNPSAASGQAETDKVFIRDMGSAAANWPLDDTDPTQSYARVINPFHEIGRNIVINGTYDADTNWTKNSNWTIADGVAHSSATSGSELYQTAPVIFGKTYRVTYTVSNYSAGSVRVGVTNNASGFGPSRSANGTYTETVLAQSGSLVIDIVASSISGTSTFVGDIDNIFVTQLNIPASPDIAAPELLTDGDMEAADTSAWTAQADAILSKETTNPYEGAQVLRISNSNSATSRTAQQYIITVGNIYRVTGYARGDGSVAPKIYDSTSGLWTGTNSSTWQPFDTTFVATTNTFRIGVSGGTTDNYVEFDDVSVTLDTSLRQGELLQDNDMETADTNAWTALNGAGLSKETTSPHEGTQLLRVTKGESGNPGARQSGIMVIGKRYKISGWVRSDGNVTPQFYQGDGSVIAVGTTSTSWQYLEATIIATSTNFQLYTENSTTNQYAEFDDISVTEVAPLVGTFKSNSDYKPSLNTDSNGHLSKAYSFDGTNDYVNIYSSDLNSVFNPDEGTLVAWAKVSGAGVLSDGNFRTISRIQADTNNLIQIHNDGSNQAIYVQYKAGGTTKITSTSNSGLTGWFQAVITWDKTNDQIKMYLNGTRVGTILTGLGTWSGNLSSEYTNIGASRITGSEPWSGLINDIRLYTRALSPDEITDLYSADSDIHAYYTENYPGQELVRKYDTNISIGTLGTETVGPGLVAYWKFDEGQGQTAQDSSSNNNNGTLGTTSGSESTDPSWVTEDQCVSSKCLHFDGTDDYANVGASSSQLKNIVNEITISAWVKPLIHVDDPYGPTIISSVDGDGYALRLKNGYLFADFRLTGGTPTAFSTNQLELNKWSFVTVTFNGSSLEGFVNGKSIGTKNISGTIKNSANSSTCVFVGAEPQNCARQSDHQYSFPGFIDEIKIYPYTRTADQILTDYSQFATSLGPSDQSSLSDGLVGYWKMDETSGTSVADASGNGNIGTLTNAQETGTSDASGNTTTTLIDTDSASLSATDDAYNGMILRFAAACGSITSGTERIISDYTGASKTISVSTTFAAPPDSCAYEIRHQLGGKFGNGMEFEGSNDYILLPNNSNTTAQQGKSITLSAWFKPTYQSISTAKQIISNGTTTGQGYFLRINPYRGGIINAKIQDNNVNRSCNLQDGLSGGSSAAVISVNTWHHAVFSWNADSGTGSLYLDGKLEKTCIDTDIQDTASPNNVVIGGSGTPTPGELFDGSIDEVRIYNRALTPSEVEGLHKFAPGPVGYWKFDEGSGTTAVDSSGNGFTTETFGGTPAWSNGKTGKSLHFNGTNDKVRVPYYDQLNTRSVSYSVWINPDSISAGGIINRGLNTPTMGHLKLQSDNKVNFLLKYEDASLVSVTSTDPVPTNQWTHLAATIDSGQALLYINGVRNNSVTLTQTLASYSNPTSIGISDWNNTTQPFSGNIDDVKIYNYARTPEQILQDMRGSSQSVIGSSTQGGLPEPVAHWSFDEQFGQSIHDQAGNNSGTLGADTGSSTDDPTWKTPQDCKVNGCLSFDGGTDYASFTSPSLANKSFSNTGWAKRSVVTGNYDVILSIGAGRTLNTTFEMGFRDSSVFFCGFYQNSLDTSQQYTDLNWHHWACVYDTEANTRKIYRDGVIVASETETSDFIGDTSGRVGAISGTPATDFFNGSIDEVKIYNFALTHNQVALDMNFGLSTGLGIGALSEASTLSDGEGNPPVAHWTFDEKSGTTVNDISGNGNSGTLGGDGAGTDLPIWSKGNKGNAMTFDGIDDYIQMPCNDGGYCDPSSSNFSVEAWFKTTDASGYIVGTAFSNDLDYWKLRISSGKAAFSINTGSAVSPHLTSTEDFNDGKWHHIAGVRDATTNGKLYIDGRLLVDQNIGGPSTGIDINGEDVFIGTNNFLTDFLQGTIDDVRIYNYARTPAQIAYDYNRGAPVAHWRFDECQGTTANDSSGNTNHGTITAGDASGSNDSVGTCQGSSGEMWADGATGKFSSSLEFDGSNDYVSVNDHDSISLSNSSWSSFAWIFINGSLDADKSVIRKQPNDFGMGFGTRQVVCIQNNTTVRVGNSLTSNTWYHIGCTYDGTTLRSFLNGAEQGNVPATQVADSNEALELGGKSNGQVLQGKADDIRIYNYALSADQVKQVMNGGTAIWFGP